jgi:ribosomal protein S20
VAHSLQAKKRAKQNTKRRTINRARRRGGKRAAQTRHKEAGQDGLDKHNAQENRCPKEITFNQASQRPQGKNGLIISDFVKR